MIPLGFTNELYVKSASAFVQSNAFVKSGSLFVSFWPPAGPSGPVFTPSGSVTATSFQDNPNTATVTFAAQSIGDADTNRVIAVFFGGSNSKDHAGVTATIQGITAVVSGSQSTSNSNFAGVAIATVPTGTTADFVLNFAGGGLKNRGCGIMVMRLLDHSTTFDDEAFVTDTLTPNALLATTNSGSIGGIFATDVANTNITWTNLTEQLESAGATAVDVSSAAQVAFVETGFQQVSGSTDSATAGATAFYVASFQLN